MPKEITHWTLAENAYQLLDDASVFKRIIQAHRHLYLIGAVIPDTPFYLLYGSGQKRMYQAGERIHNHPHNSYEPLENMIQKTRHSNGIPDALMALMLGILTHIHADSAFHPLVSYFTENNRKSRKNAVILHRKFEAYLDIYYAENSLYKIGKTFFSDILKNQEMAEKTFLRMLSAFFSVPDMSLIKKSLGYHSFIQKQFDNTLLKRMLQGLPFLNSDIYLSSFYPRIKPDPKCLFSYPFLYRHPVTGREIRESANEAAERAVCEILKVFKRIELIYPDTPYEIFSGLKGPNLHTGMIGVPKSAMRYFCSVDGSCL